MSDDRLYGRDGDERLHLDLQSAIEQQIDDTYGRVDFPISVVVDEFTVLPKGDFACAEVPDGAHIAERVIEWYTEECGFEEVWEQYERAAKMPDVVAAFQAARDLLVSKQTFLYADRVVARWRCEITGTTESNVAITTDPVRVVVQ